MNGFGIYIPLPYATQEFCNDSRQDKVCEQIVDKPTEKWCHIFDVKIELYFGRPMRCDECKAHQIWRPEGG